MSICFSNPRDRDCKGPRLELTDDQLVDPICAYCTSLRTVSHEVIGENTRRLGKIRKIIARPDLTAARMHAKITKEVETTLTRVFSAALGGAQPPCAYAFLVCGSIARREPVTYSDIDALLVISEDRDDCRDFFKKVATKMQQALQLSGGGHTQFKFCPGGLSPVYICNTPANVVEYIDAEAKKGNTHLLGAMQTRMVFGDPTVADEYEEACWAKLKGRKRKKSDKGKAPCNPTMALDHLEEVLKKRDVHYLLEGFAPPKPGDLIINMKSQLYRPVHLIATELGLYYGVPGWSTREIIANLTEAGHMSLDCAYFLMNILEDVGKLRIARQLEAGTEYELLRLRELTRDDKFDDERDRDIAINEPLASPERIATAMACTKRTLLLWEMTEHFVAMKRRGMVADWDIVGRIQPMKTAEFDKFVGLKGYRKKGVFDKSPHLLQQIHDKLQAYHALAKPMLQTRHQLLADIRTLCQTYLAKKKGSKARTVKARAVETLAYQADGRLTLEQTRAKELSDRINKPTTHVKPIGGHGASIRFERVAKPGKIAVSGVELINAVEYGALKDQIELQHNDDYDLYAMKKLLKTLDEEKLLAADLKKLEYADDAKRAEYRVNIEMNRLMWAKAKKPVDTMATIKGDPPRTALYSMDLVGRLYAHNFDSQDRRGEFAHSSLLAGEEAICAGCIKVKNGRILEITNTSGHYQPKLQHLLDVCREIVDHYDPNPEGHALFGDFAMELPATIRSRDATGHYRIPLMLFCDQGKDIPDIEDFEVKRHDERGYWEYVDKAKAEARGAVDEKDMDLKEIRKKMLRTRRIQSTDLNDLT